MTTKCTGAEYSRFMTDTVFWREGSGDQYTWFDEAVITINGAEVEDVDLEKLGSADVLTLEGGIVLGPVVGASEPSLETYFKRWKKAQSTTVLCVEMPNDKVEAIKAAIKAAGGKVLG